MQEITKTENIGGGTLASPRMLKQKWVAYLKRAGLSVLLLRETMSSKQSACSTENYFGLSPRAEYGGLDYMHGIWILYFWPASIEDATSGSCKIQNHVITACSISDEKIS
jgi:hypothetical protein